MNLARSPSRSGQRSICQWLGIRQYAHTRIGVSSSVSCRRPSRIEPFCLRVHRHGPRWSTGDCRKVDIRIIAQRRDGFQGRVATALDGPLVILFEQDRTDEADDGVLVGEDGDQRQYAA